MILSHIEQAERAERLARSTNDVRAYEALMKYAGECRMNALTVSQPEKSSAEGPVRPG
jgi:hypothetical protein